jgi:hypothetical protein
MDLDRVNFSLGQEQEDKDSFASFVQQPNFALADRQLHENEAPPKPIQEGAEYLEISTLLELFGSYLNWRKDRFGLSIQGPGWITWVGIIPKTEYGIGGAQRARYAFNAELDLCGGGWKSTSTEGKSELHQIRR